MADLENNSSAESLSGSKNTLQTGAKAAKAGAEAAKKAAQSQASKKLIASLISLLGPQSKMVVAIIAMVLIPFIVMISILPMGNLFMSQGEVESTEDKVYEILEDSFDAARKNAKPDIKKFVNEKYAARAKDSDIKYSNGTFTIDTDYALITVSLSPPLSTMKNNIAAYINAVNGAINACGEETSTELKKFENAEEKEPTPKYDGNIFEKDEDGNPVVTQGVKDFLKEYGNQDTYTASDEYLEAIIEDKDSFFTHDKKTKRWDLVNFHQGPKTHMERKRVKGEDGKYHTEWVPVTVTAWYGHINIAMFYDLSGYREDELDKAAELMSEGRNEDDFVNGAQLGTVLDSYYSNYIAVYKAMPGEDGEVILGEDNRNDIFQKLLDDGTLMYVPISGLTEKYLSYVGSGKGYSGRISSSEYDNMSTAQIWAHANSIATQMYPYNCTTFAAAWFYDHYGKNILRGNGRDCVNNLLATKWGKKRFYRSGAPAPGAIFSIGRPGGGNHVGCVEAVDFEKKTITISDGNTNGAGNSSRPWTATVRIKETMTFDQFKQYVSNCCAVHGDYQPRVVFACPKKGAFDSIEVEEEKEEP